MCYLNGDTHYHNLTHCTSHDIENERHDNNEVNYLTHPVISMYLLILNIYTCYYYEIIVHYKVFTVGWQYIRDEELEGEILLVMISFITCLNIYG